MHGLSHLLFGSSRQGLTSAFNSSRKQSQMFVIFNSSGFTLVPTTLIQKYTLSLFRATDESLEQKSTPHHASNSKPTGCRGYVRLPSHIKNTWDPFQPLIGLFKIQPFMWKTCHIIQNRIHVCLPISTCS
jgi:hypothetical protein